MVESSNDITVSVPSVIFGTIFETLLPIVLGFIWIRKYNGRICYIFKGVGGFVGSVMIESIFLFLMTKFFGKGSTIFNIIAGISPGLFEETGKYLLIKYIYSKEKLKNNAVSYGIGHGGIESYFVGMSLLANIFAKDVLIEQGALKQSITFSGCLLGVCERISAITLQISLAIINYKAIREQNIHFYFLAIILHDLIDFFAILYQKDILTSLFVVELFIGILAVSVFWYAYNLYSNYDEQEVEKIMPLEDKKEPSIVNNFN